MLSEVTNEDCMELMARYPDKYFDLAIVDPPYGIGASKKFGLEEFGWKQFKRSDWDNSIPSAEYFIELQRVSKNQIVWGGNYMTEYLPPSMGWIIWNKGQRGFTLADGEMAWTSFKKAMRIFDFSRAECIKSNNTGLDKFHPTAKPYELYKWLLDKYAKQGDKILDTHLGSGSSRIAAYSMGFDFVGCELDKEYFDAQEKRFNNFKSQLTLF